MAYSKGLGLPRQDNSSEESEVICPISLCAGSIDGQCDYLVVTGLEINGWGGAKCCASAFHGLEIHLELLIGLPPLSTLLMAPVWSIQYESFPVRP